MLIKKMERFMESFAGEDQCQILSKSEFRRSVEREQALADRTGAALSLVAFHAYSLRRDSKQLKGLTIAFRETRFVDEVGWYRDGVGILLPFTSVAGAYRLASRILQAFSLDDDLIDYTVYTYSPSQGTNPTVKSSKATDLPRLRDTDSMREVHPPLIFRRLLERARAMSDRTGQGFSLLVLDCPSKRQVAKQMKNLLKMLDREIRLTDELGWLEGKIGVFLPLAAPSGAERLRGRVEKCIRSPGISISNIVYSYPIPNESDAMLSADERSWSNQDSSSTAQGKSITTRSILFFLILDTPFSKRIFALVGALFGIVTSLFVLLVISVWIKSVSPGPILFRQTRIGYRQLPFQMWKFRTMYYGLDEDIHSRHLTTLLRGGSLAKLDASWDQRIIPGGQILRRSGLDELPQLFNVLRGDMSLVGPRPCLPYEYRAFDLWHTRRFDCLPGMTGLWQISGKNSKTFKQMMRLDIAYTIKSSILLDFLICLKQCINIEQLQKRSVKSSRLSRRRLQVRLSEPGPADDHKDSSADIR